MATAIKPKTATKGRQFSEHAKRYIFYPLHNLDFAATQATSPIWCPKIPAGRFVLLESFDYRTVVDNGDDTMNSNEESSLGYKIMGTNHQVSFLMGSTDGSGYMERGMTHLEPLLDVDPDTASEVEEILIPSSIPFALSDFLTEVRTREIPDTPVGELAKKVKPFIEQSINTAIAYCQRYTSELEKELDTGRRGGTGIKHLSENAKFYFNKISRRIPDEHRVSGDGIGTEIAKVLAPLMQQREQVIQDNSAEIELEILRKKLEDAENINRELEEAIVSLTSEEETNEHTES